MNNFPIDGTRITNIISIPDPDSFKMPNRFYREGSSDYELMIDRYNRLNNKPKFNGQIVPIGVLYGASGDSYTPW